MCQKFNLEILPHVAGADSLGIEGGHDVPRWKFDLLWNLAVLTGNRAVCLKTGQQICCFRGKQYLLTPAPSTVVIDTGEDSDAGDP